MTISPEEIDARADEYVLGLLSEAEAAAFEERMARDDRLAARVGELRDSLLPLDLSAAPVEPPAGFAARIRHALGEPREDEAEPVSAPARTHRMAAAPQRVGWLMAACVAGMIAGFSLGWLRPAPEPVVVAVLLDAEGVPQAVIEDYGNDTARILFVADVDVPADKTIQAWTLPSREMGPTSLGIIDEAGPTLLRAGDLPPPAPRQLYEITLEPKGGSPTGRPTGPILSKGFAAIQG